MCGVGGGGHAREDTGVWVQEGAAGRLQEGAVWSYRRCRLCRPCRERSKGQGGFQRAAGPCRQMRCVAHPTASHRIAWHTAEQHLGLARPAAAGAAQRAVATIAAQQHAHHCATAAAAAAGRAAAAAAAWMGCWRAGPRCCPPPPGPSTPCRSAAHPRRWPAAHAAQCLQQWHRYSSSSSSGAAVASAGRAISRVGPAGGRSQPGLGWAVLCLPHRVQADGPPRPVWASSACLPAAPAGGRTLNCQASQYNVQSVQSKIQSHSKKYTAMRCAACVPASTSARISGSFHGPSSSIRLPLLWPVARHGTA